MGLFSPHLTNTVEKYDPIAHLWAHKDPVFKGLTGYLTKKVTPSPLAPPTQDTAANASLDQQQEMMRRRGVLGNVYGGATGAGSAPSTQSKSVLGV